MDPTKHFDCLCFLREEIAALLVVKCRISHERIIRSGESMLPVISRLPGGSYQRVGLCSHEVRAQRLSCSHTTARIKLGDAIAELNIDDSEGRERSPLLAGKLNWLDNQIHLLDHRKGEAEKAIAKIEEDIYGAGSRSDREEELWEAKKAILELEQLHDEYVEQMGALRDRVVNELDRLIEQARMNQSADAEELG
jgi:hypothetical protein